VGEMVDERARRLVKVARQCRDVGISMLRPGIPIAAIGAAIQYVLTSFVLLYYSLLFFFFQFIIFHYTIIFK
jgi:methionine aminopeptidase